MKMNMKNITKFLSIILISVFVMSLSTNVFAGAFLNASEFDNIDKATNVTNMVTNAAETTVSVLRIAGVTIAVVMLLAVAMKYMLSSAGDRADIKKHAIAYVVGAVVLFGATNIIAAIIEFTDQVVK
ncbi:MAG: hypothetical protein IKJ36_04570 [Clostridia bacterium]|nr:hypothetical protein [Clostridia bacterium]